MNAYLVVGIVLFSVMTYGCVGAIIGTTIHRHWMVKCRHHGTGRCDEECVHWWSGLVIGLFWPVAWALAIPIYLSHRLGGRPVYSHEEMRLAEASTKLELQRKIVRTEKELERFRGW